MGTLEDGVTPLTVAAARGNEVIVRMLLQRGAIADRRHKNGWSAWSTAMEKGEEHIADILKAAGAREEFPPLQE